MWSAVQHFRAFLHHLFYHHFADKGTAILQTFCLVTKFHEPEDMNLQHHCHENSKFHSRLLADFINALTYTLKISIYGCQKWTSLWLSMDENCIVKVFQKDFQSILSSGLGTDTTAQIDGHDHCEVCARSTSFITVIPLVLKSWDDPVKKKVVCVL